MTTTPPTDYEALAERFDAESDEAMLAGYGIYADNLTDAATAIRTLVQRVAELERERDAIAQERGK